MLEYLFFLIPSLSITFLINWERPTSLCLQHGAVARDGERGIQCTASWGEARCSTRGMVGGEAQAKHPGSDGGVFWINSGRAVQFFAACMDRAASHYYFHFEQFVDYFVI